MQPGYEYHVFISYRRTGDVGEWVHNHFHPVLVRRLEAVLDEEPKVFLDAEMEIGSHWPQRLSDALHRSCCMVPVWSPSYFRSGWCMAEWRTIIERERAAGLGSAGRPGIVYPVVYSDGDSFPAEAQEVQSRRNMHDFTYPYEQFRKSDKYMAFFDLMTEVAHELTSRLHHSPPWNANWPTLPASTDTPLPSPPQFARL